MRRINAILARWRREKMCRFLVGLMMMFFAVLLTGCLVGPDYERPEIEMPGEMGAEHALRWGTEKGLRFNRSAPGS